MAYCSCHLFPALFYIKVILVFMCSVHHLNQCSCFNLKKYSFFQSSWCYGLLFFDLSLAYEKMLVSTNGLNLQRSFTITLFFCRIGLIRLFGVWCLMFKNKQLEEWLIRLDLLLLVIFQLEIIFSSHVWDLNGEKLGLFCCHNQVVL